MLRILLVDDDAPLTRLLRLGIEQTGEFEVRVANSGAAALAAVADFAPDIVLLDIIMPDMRGTDVLTELRARGLNRDTRVVFLTAVPPHDALVRSGYDPEAALINGCPYLIKPVTTAQVLAEVKRVLAI
jgi:two-component system OmpR family response regulator